MKFNKLLSKSILLNLAIFFFFFIYYSLIMGGHLYSPDEEVMFRTTASIAEYHGFAIQPLLPGGDQRFTQIGKFGRFYGHYGLGQSLLAVPLYFVGSIAANILPPQWNEVFRNQEFSWQRNMTRFAVSRFNQIITALTCLLLFQFGIKLGYSKKSTILVIFIYGLATIAVPHSKTFFSEPLATLLLLFTFYGLMRYKQTAERQWIIWSGASLGYAILTRMDSIITIPIYAIYLLHLGISRNDKLKNIVLWLIPIGFFCGLVAWYNFVRFGSVTTTGYEAEGLTFQAPMLDGIYGLLLSSGRSIFLFSPPIILFFVAIKPFWQEHRDESYCCIAIALVYLLFYSKWESWAGGWSWGPRHIFQIHSFLLIPLFTLFEKYTQHPSKWFWSSIIILVAIGMFVQTAGVLVSFMDYHQWLLQRVPDLWYSLYIPVHSSLVGHWILAKQGMLDLFVLRLWQSQLPWFIKSLPILAIFGMVLCGYYILKRMSAEKI